VAGSNKVEMDEREILKDGFARFVAAASELEASYAALKTRAEAVDVQLADSNRALQQSLAEREAMFAALPIGLVAARTDGTVGSSNCEANRLIEAAQSSGVDLLSADCGEVAFDESVVRVRRVDLPDGELVLLEDRSRLEELEREVQRLDRLAGLSELALGVAHEIKNPLNGVMGFSNLLERSEDVPTMHRYAGKISEGVKAVDEIVKGLLGFARPAEKPISIAPLEQLIERVALASNLPRSRWKLSGALNVKVDADALGRVMANLIRNAMEASPHVSLTMDAKVHRGQLELLVEDDGPGVSADVAQKVFEPFVSTKQRGTGLGLALSTRVLSFLGGELELLNPGDPGARFRVRIPIVASEVSLKEAVA
jgi:signal transduction histidine kinase